MRRNPKRPDSWEEIGDAALDKPFRFLFLLIRQFFKDIFRR